MLESLRRVFRPASEKDVRGITPQSEMHTPDPFASDSPVADPQLDRFKRLPFAQRVAKTLAERRDPSSIVVLIHGEWGEGKTTILEYIRGALYKFNNVVPVRFNPWRVSDETSLLLSFFSTLATALDRSPKTSKEKLGDLFRKYGDVVGEISIEANGTKFSAGHAVSKLGEKLSFMTLEEQRERIGNMLKEAGKRIVVFLDDIDRLDRKEAQAVFKLLKLTADFAYVSYVLAFDRDIVAAAIGEQYGSGDTRSGHHYLEKIIQVSLNLPVADCECLAQLCGEGISDSLKIAEVSLTPEQEQEFQVAFLQYIVPELRTPRLAKLYANSVAGGYSLDSGSRAALGHAQRRQRHSVGICSVRIFLSSDQGHLSAAVAAVGLRHTTVQQSRICNGAKALAYMAVPAGARKGTIARGNAEVRA